MDAFYNPNSQANLIREAFGLRKQDTIRSSVSMFANRYSWQKALELASVNQAFAVQLAQR